MEVLDGKYQLEQLLGQGGMGAVYKAVHLGTKRTVAVKVINPQLSNRDEFITRFRREAEAAGRLRHPNVVDVTDFGFAETQRGPVAYLVMEYLDGCTLAEIVSEEGPLPVPWVIDILDQTCSAVAEAHRVGIIHRDLKPDNIWLEPNHRGGYTVKVLDFGLVKLADASVPVTNERPPRSRVDSESPTFLRSTEEDNTLLKSARTSIPQPNASPFELHKSPVNSNGRLNSPNGVNAQTTKRTDAETLTVVGSVMGTPVYMSPEQCRGDNLDSRSDIYSLGVIAYRLLTGEAPFTGSFEELMEQHQFHEPISIRDRNHKLSRRMAQIVMAALAKEREKRPESAAGFAASLRESWEGTGYLLRHAFALYSEHFPTLLRISLIGYLPLILVLVISNVDLRDFQDLGQMQQAVLGISMFALMVVSLLGAYFFVTAATVPIVLQLIVSPLRTLKVTTALTALKRRWRVLVVTSLLVGLMILVGGVLFIVPGIIIATIYALYAPVAIMEDLNVRATLRRSRTLSRRARTATLLITLLQFLLPLLVWKAAVNTNFTLKLNDDFSPKEFGFNFSMSGRSALYQLLNVFVTPLIAIMISLLYLKTRRAGGESLKDAIDHFDALDIPRSRWQSRMRTGTSARTNRA